MTKDQRKQKNSAPRVLFKHRLQLPKTHPTGGLGAGAEKRRGLPEHLTMHLMTVAELNRAGRYDRMAELVTNSY